MGLDKNSTPKEVADEMQKDIAETIKGLEEGKYSQDEIAELKEDFQNIELEALKIKISFLLDSFVENEPNLSTKEILIKVFQKLPEHTSESLLPKLADYICQNWKPLSRKIAA